MMVTQISNIDKIDKLEAIQKFIQFKAKIISKADLTKVTLRVETWETLKITVGQFCRNNRLKSSSWIVCWYYVIGGID